VLLYSELPLFGDFFRARSWEMGREVCRTAVRSSEGVSDPERFV